MSYLNADDGNSCSKGANETVMQSELKAFLVQAILYPEEILRTREVLADFLEEKGHSNEAVLLRESTIREPNYQPVGIAVGSGTVCLGDIHGRFQSGGDVVVESGDIRSGSIVFGVASGLVALPAGWRVEWLSEKQPLTPFVCGALRHRESEAQLDFAWQVACLLKSLILESERND